MLLKTLKLFYVFLLIIVFVMFFGKSSLEKFLEGKTMFVESKIKVFHLLT